MNVLIFGATGATGMHLVNQPQVRGHSVTAFVRDPARLKRT
jgi:putative NADH-flavin reductase